MSAPKSFKTDGAEDLSIRARRLGLSLEEQRLFDRACDASPNLRVSHQVGCDFDRISVVRAGDEELIARVADRVLASSRRGRRGRKFAWGFGLAVALVSSGAAAWWGGVVRPESLPSALSLRSTVRTWWPAFAFGRRHSIAPPAQSIAPPAQSVEAPAHPPDLAAEAAPPRVADFGLAVDDGSRRVVVPPGSHTAPPTKALRPGHAVTAAAKDTTAEADVETAPECFRRANAARHAGDLTAAAVFYARLQRKFPASDEARLSHVSLGKLLLGSGRAQEAERQFSMYLAAGGRELAEEAWVGRAESLERLGGAAEERRSWQRLLQDFPASVYAARARQRLEELEARGL
jgi:TolA-binding protein